MTKDEIEYKVKNLICGITFGEADVIELSDRFTEELNFDGLDEVELTMNLEREFGIAIPDAEIENIKTVNDLINLIENKLLNP